MKIVVFGAGYVGLVTGAGLSDLGHEVLVLDSNAERVRLLDQYVDGFEPELPIHEPGLGEIVRRNARAERLHFDVLSSTLDRLDAEAYFIAVGTPPLEDGSADVSHVMLAALYIGRLASKDSVVVVKSTVPVGTTDKVQAILDETSELRLEAVSNPEFLKEGDAINDFFKPDRVVVGASSDRAREVMRRLYAPLNLSGERPLLFMDAKSSELVKYAANAMLAMRISFMNELARLCSASGASIHDVRLGVGSDSRIGRKFLYAGPGYGGSCFPKDVQALVHVGAKYDVPMRVAEAAHLANEEQAAFLADLVFAAAKGVEGKTVVLWGLAFKPETDDVREAPSVKLAKTLLERGAFEVVGHDPEAGGNFSIAVDGRVSIARDEYAALSVNGGAHALVLLTEWRCYRAPDWELVARAMRPGGAVIDARNIWRCEDVVRAGLRYRSIGGASGNPPDRGYVHHEAGEAAYLNGGG